MPDLSTPRRPPREPVSYPPSTVLNPEQLAAALDTSVDTLERDGDWIPWFTIGVRGKRVVWGQVLEILQQRAERALRGAA